MDRESGWRNGDPLGRCLVADSGTRVQSQDDIRRCPRANLLDWPITLSELEPYYEKAETKLGVTRTGDRPGLPGCNNYKVFEAGAKAIGYKEVHTGRMAINSVEDDARCLRGGKFH